MENKAIFTRQEKIFNPTEQKTKITIIGVGSVGSFICLNLAKMGFNNIKIIDFDSVEKENIPNQFFRVDDVGKSKVDAISEITKDFTGLEVEKENIEIKEDYNFDIQMNELIVVAVDSIEVRKLIYEKIKEYPIKFIDCRTGGEDYSIQLIDLDNEEEKAKYEKSLDLPTSNLPCGEKTILYMNLSITSEVCNLIKRIDKGEETRKVIKRTMKGYTILGK